MAAENEKPGAKPRAKSRRLLNPRRVQSLLRRVHEITLSDAKNPLLTAQEKLEYFKAGAEYAKLLAAADGRRRAKDKAQRAVEKKELADKSNSTWPW
jgi:hypothetical protein